MQSTSARGGNGQSYGAETVKREEGTEAEQNEYRETAGGGSVRGCQSGNKESGPEGRGAGVWGWVGRGRLRLASYLSTLPPSRSLCSLPSNPLMGPPPPARHLSPGRGPALAGDAASLRVGTVDAPQRLLRQVHINDVVIFIAVAAAAVAAAAAAEV